MTGKRRPIVKLLRHFLSQSPPANVAPWVQPNNKLKAVIAKSTRGRLGASVQEAQRTILAAHVKKALRRSMGKDE